LIEQVQVLAPWVLYQEVDAETGENRELVLAPNFTTDPVFSELSAEDITRQPSGNIPTAPNSHIVLVVGETALLDLLEADESVAFLPGTRSEV